MGDYTATTSPQLLQRLGVLHVVSLDVVRPELGPGLAQLFLQISDEAESNLLELLPEAVQLMEAVVGRGEGVMVHCRHGVSRSVAVVAAFLVARGWGLEAALERVREVRPQAGPNRGFLDQLGLWERMGGRLEVGDTSYIHFILQRGQLVYQGDLPRTDTKQEEKSYKCRKCRRLLALSSHVIPHQLGVFPSLSSPSLPSQCPSSLLLTPQPWMSSSELLGSSCRRLLCPGCSSKLGWLGLGWRCSCGAQGGRGSLLLLGRVDVANITLSRPQP